LLTEIPLSGGNVNAEVVRVGNTVRRVPSEHAQSIHALLQHVHAHGFLDCPEFLGVDEKNREILSYIEGEVGPSSALWKEDLPLVQVASMLRRFHDASASFPRSKMHTWALTYPDPLLHEVICHNDFAAYNMIFANGLPAGIIDFDMAGPGPRLKDVAYAAYWFVPLAFRSSDMKPHALKDIANGCQRLRLFCSTYGVAVDASLLDMVVEVLDHMGDKQALIKALGEDIAQRIDDGGHLAHWQAEAVEFRGHRDEIESALTQWAQGSTK